MLVKDIMSAFVITIEEDDNLRETAKKMRDLDIGCLLVCRDNTVAGIVTDRDITCKGVADGLDIEALTVSDVMSKDIVWCNENEDVEDAIRLMEDSQVRRLPVLDDEKNLVCVLSLGDISTHLSHELSGEVIEAIPSTSHKILPIAVD